MLFLRLKRILLFLIFCLLALPAAGCGDESGQTQEYTGEIFAMDTYMTLDVYCDSQELVDRAESRIFELESLFSVTEETSEIYAVNENGSGTLSDETAYVLERTLELCGLTGGTLDITVYPVALAWGFTTQKYRIPDSGELEELLERVDYSRVRLEDGQVSLEPGMKIDLGSVVKGYAGDNVVEMLSGEGVTSALLNLGGDVQALGAKPDGSLWRVAVQDPNESSGYVGIISIEDQSVVTSGGYERYFEGEDGEIYWHILDPATGSSAKAGLVSVTVVSDSGLYGDALSTALFVMGESEAVDFWREQGDFEMILVTDDDRVLVSEGLEDSFELRSDYAMEIVRT